MQYVLKLTVLGVKEPLFRVVSVEGRADVEHVLNLCNIAFDYVNYSNKSLYFAKNAQAKALLSPDMELEDGLAFYYAKRDFYREELDLTSATNNLDKLDVATLPAINHFDDLIAAKSSEYASQGGFIEAHRVLDSNPTSTSERFRFLYVLEGIVHLVEIMTCSAKLKCFLPACLMGNGVISTTEESKFELDFLNAQLNEHGDDIVDLKQCSARMRSLGALRPLEQINAKLQEQDSSVLKFQVAK